MNRETEELRKALEFYARFHANSSVGHRARKALASKPLPPTDDVRARALEEAAQLVEAKWNMGPILVSREIRALSAQSPPPADDFLDRARQRANDRREALHERLARQSPPLNMGEGLAFRGSERMDKEGLAQWREMSRSANGHDIAGANNNTISRFVATIDYLTERLATSPSSDLIGEGEE